MLTGGDQPEGGEAALRALADVTEARRALERAELSAVRAARRHGQSWTEIATMLAISRQSAWERWRDLDAETPLSVDRPNRLVQIAANELAERARRRRMVTVPDVVGFTAPDALGILTRAGLDALSATPELRLQEQLDDPRPILVVRQYPDSGTRVRAASVVRLWLERGDGEAGVREPRRPKPSPRVARIARDEQIREEVG